MTSAHSIGRRLWPALWLCLGLAAAARAQVPQPSDAPHAAAAIARGIAATVLAPATDLGAGRASANPGAAAPGSGRPNGANDANLRAMVAVPADLAVATPASPADGHLAAAAVNRLRNDHVKSLPDSGLAQIVVAGSGSTAQPAAAAPAGNGN